MRDVWSRLPTLLVEVTVYRSILKIDSTKKVCKKLQGADADTAAWATNVGNEKGEILISVLTQSEGILDLQRLANGLMDRFDNAQQESPQILYTDRDCCSQNGPSKFNVLFSRWSGLHVCLDIWHFMRRLACGCTSESHPLYGTFMGKLSNCIFEWDADDFDLLISAKKSELVKAGIANPSDNAAKNAITKDELARHCRRRTRGTEWTTDLIEKLLLGLSTATDPLGVPVLREDMKDIWAEQKHHVRCLQDPPNIQLYTIMSYSMKGGVRLPVFRCARGSTSLESFHLHLSRFIPGSCANAVNFQAYLLDGITRWNAERASQALQSSSISLRTFDTSLKHRVNVLSQSLHGSTIFPLYRPPHKYTGEFFGVEYLYHQSCLSLLKKDLDTEIDEGFGDIDDASTPPPLVDVDEPTIAIPEASDDDSDSGEEEEVCSNISKNV